MRYVASCKLYGRWKNIISYDNSTKYKNAVACKMTFVRCFTACPLILARCFAIGRFQRSWPMIRFTGHGRLATEVHDIPVCRRNANMMTEITETSDGTLFFRHGGNICNYNISADKYNQYSNNVNKTRKILKLVWHNWQPMELHIDSKIRQFAACTVHTGALQIALSSC